MKQAFFLFYLHVWKVSKFCLSFNMVDSKTAGFTNTMLIITCYITFCLPGGSQSLSVCQHPQILGELGVLYLGFLSPPDVL